MKQYGIIRPDPTLQSNLMAFGYECNDGWYSLIEELLDKIQAIVDKTPEIKDLEVLQIKEKYASLRVYLSYETDEISDLIEEYTKKSTITCEVCGEPGSVREDRHWYKTLCHKHFEEWIKH
jgi:formylmethanofuran dehydrogenase subunit E